MSGIIRWFNEGWTGDWVFNLVGLMILAGFPAIVVLIVLAILGIPIP